LEQVKALIVELQRRQDIEKERGASPSPLAHFKGIVLNNPAVNNP
jgi:hypothetical protein